MPARTLQLFERIFADGFEHGKAVHRIAADFDPEQTLVHQTAQQQVRAFGVALAPDGGNGLNRAGLDENRQVME